MVPGGPTLGRLGALALRKPVLAALGDIAFVMVLTQVLHRPPTVSDDASRDVGAWLALASAALLTLGGVLASLRVSIDVRSGVRDPAAATTGEQVAYRPTPASAPPGLSGARPGAPDPEPASAGIEGGGAAQAEHWRDLRRRVAPRLAASARVLP